ncbi:hypothetical protein QTP88_025689 [Uroleucon formosanum]
MTIYDTIDRSVVTAVLCYDKLMLQATHKTIKKSQSYDYIQQINIIKNFGN